MARLQPAQQVGVGAVERERGAGQGVLKVEAKHQDKVDGCIFHDSK